MTLSYVSGSARVIRGGSWLGGPQYARAANRGSITPGFRGINLGVRLVRRCL